MRVAVADAEGRDVAFQLGDEAEVAFDEDDGGGAAAEGFEADDAGAGEDVEEGAGRARRRRGC